MTTPQIEAPAVVTDIPSTEQKEPALGTGGLVAVGTLFVNGFAMFVMPLDPEQKVYLIALFTFLAPLLAAGLIRFKVFAPKTVEQIRMYYEVQLREKDHQLIEARASAGSQAAVAGAIENTMPALFARLPVQPTFPPAAYAPQEPPQAARPQETAPDQAWVAPAIQAPGQVPARASYPTERETYPGYGSVEIDGGPGLPEGYRRHRRTGG